ETKQEIRRVYEKYHYLCDTHTAVASAVYGKYAAETGDSATPAIVVSTANPYKFPSDVLDAVTGGRHAAVSGFEAVRVLSEMTGTPVPEPIAELEDKPVRFGTVCAKEEMGAEVLKFASGTFE
ncbi:MAG TPA: threonine synthase, partial [Ruminococcaceae bacterium]|nr:threonine synthase [Oscillospiraceae bacterium]